MPAGGWVIALLTLTAMEIVLGIDNVIFIAIAAGRLPLEQQSKARRLGLVLALGTRLLLLFTLSFLLGFDKVTLFHLSDLGVPAEWLGREEVNSISVRDAILIAGGLFLIAKSTYEIHNKLEGGGDSQAVTSEGGFAWTLVQIAVLDIVFSLDSVVTAVGMSGQLWVMVTAMVVAAGVMLLFAGAIGNFVHRHPTLKMLALSFLILIGVMLVAEGIDKHIERGYIYFAMAFSLGVELLNLKLRKQTAPVEPHASEAVSAERGGRAR
jgi:predicted tellurium resistance membrane protein TerC